MEPQKTLNTEAILRKKNGDVGVTLPDFRLCSRAIIIKTAWYRQKIIHTDGWNTTESPEINLPVDGKIYFLKILFIFRGRGREGEKHQCVVASCAPPTGDPAHNPGLCALTGN